VVLSFVLSVPFGSTGIWCSWPVGWTIGMSISVFFYLRGPWRKVQPEPEQ
jgi:Na+-driven multidrug efflux pump